MRYGLLALALLVPACAPAEEDDVQGLTAEESAQLNDAAAMLDTNSSDLALPPAPEAPARP